MEEADDVFVAVQAVLEYVQTEFTQAAQAMPDGKWWGLSHEARQRIAVKSREEVARLRSILDRVGASLDEQPALRLGPARMEHEIDMQTLRLKHAQELLAMLPPVGTEPPPLEKGTEKEASGAGAGGEGSSKATTTAAATSAAATAMAVDR